MIDKLMQKYGYIKTGENEYGAYYKNREPQIYDHIVCVIRKESGSHIMQSYDDECLYFQGRGWINEGVGVEIQVLLLMWLKAKYLSIKYRWGNKRCKMT